MEPEIEHQPPYCIDCTTEVDCLDDGQIRCPDCGATWTFDLTKYDHYRFSEWTNDELEPIEPPSAYAAEAIL